MIKKYLPMAVAGAVLALGSATTFAEEKSPVAANIALTNNYVWRGVSQTAKQMALQGGFDWAHDSGFYLGFWGSNVNFGNDAPGSNGEDGAQLEADIYGGYKFKAGPVELDLGILAYNYPGAASSLKYDFVEAYVGAGYGPVGVKFSYTDDYQGITKKEATYLEANANIPLADVATLILHVGSSGGDGVKEAFSAYGGTYVDYKVGVSKEFGGYGFTLAYTDTNHDNKKPAGKLGAADGMVLVSVARSF